MPTVQKPCNKIGCRELITKGSYCTKHSTALRQAYDKARGSSTERGYDGKWRKARAAYLRTHYECIHCKQQGKLTPATVVDHIQPHRQDMKLFWDKTNWQSLCKPCHDGWKQQRDRAGQSSNVPVL